LARMEKLHVPMPPSRWRISVAVLLIFAYGVRCPMLMLVGPSRSSEDATVKKAPLTSRAPLRRQVLAETAAVLQVAGGMASPAAAEDNLGALLGKRQGLELRAPFFNIPPREQVFPEWLEGAWNAKQVFSGFEFPFLPKNEVMRQVDVPGFKTCSIIDFADVGKSPVEYELRWVKKGGSIVEDMPFNLRSSVRAHLGGKGQVTQVAYEPEKDANRLSVYIQGSRNAERVELFVNSRRSDSAGSGEGLYITSEYRRQATFSSRVLQGDNGNYQHFRTFQRIDNDHVRLNVLTASYIDPLSPLFFQAWDKPVVIFSHELSLSRQPVQT